MATAGQWWTTTEYPSRLHVDIHEAWSAWGAPMWNPGPASFSGPPTLQPSPLPQGSWSASRKLATFPAGQHVEQERNRPSLGLLGSSLCLNQEHGLYFVQYIHTYRRLSKEGCKGSMADGSAATHAEQKADHIAHCLHLPGWSTGNCGTCPVARTSYEEPFEQREIPKGGR